MNAKFLSLVVIIPYIVVFWFFEDHIFGSNFEKVVYRLELSLYPLYALIMILAFLKESTLVQKISYGKLLSTHFALFFGYVMLVFFIAPVYTNNVIYLSKKEAKEKIMKAYSYADLIGEKKELQAYVVYYHNHPEFFGDIDIPREFIQGIPSTKEKKELNPDATTPPFYSTEITSDSIYALTRGDILFRTKNFIESNEFVSAQAHINNYKKIYGEDEDIRFLSELLDFQTKSSNQDIMYQADRAKKYYDQFKYFYYLIEKKDADKDSLLLAYKILESFVYNSKLDKIDEVLWIQKQIYDKLLGSIFFAREARINLLNFAKDYNVVFITEEKGERYIWHAPAARLDYSTGDLYLKDLEIISISLLTKEVLWHMSTPYAKITENKLFVSSSEDMLMDRRYNPTISYIQNSSIVLPAFISTGIREDLVVNANIIDVLRPDYQYVFKKNIYQLVLMIKSWNKYHLPVNMLMERIFQLVLLAGLFLLQGLVLIKILIRTEHGFQTFTSAKNDSVIVSITFLSLYGLLEALGIFFIRRSSMIQNGIYIVVLGLILALVSFIEIRTTQNIIPKKYRT